MQIHTERLILREFRADDWQAVLEYQRKPQYLRYYAWTDRTPEAVREFVQMFLRNQKENPRTKYQLAVTLKSTGHLIGNCGIRMREPDAHEADIGFELDPSSWGQGLATEAARAIVDYGFTHLHLHRIWSWCVADNKGSARVLEKLGMHKEGRQRDKEFYRDRYWDVLLYGILESEWLQRPLKHPYLIF